DGVGRLAGGGGEVLHREREECPVGQRVSIQQEQPVPLLAWRGGLGRLGHHGRSLVAGTDGGAAPWGCGPARRRGGRWGQRVAARPRPALPISEACRCLMFSA